MNEIERFFSDSFNDIKQSFTAPSRLMESIGKSLTSNPVIPMLLVGCAGLFAYKMVSNK